MERIKVWEIGKPKYCNPGGKMKMVDIELNDEDYNLLKKIDFSEIKDEVFFDDEKRKFRTSSPLASVIFEEYINTHAFDNSGLYKVTPFGRKLYDLYDLIFYSEPI